MRKPNTIDVAIYVLLGLLALLFWFGVFRTAHNVIGASADEVNLGARVPWNCTNFFTAPHPRPLTLENDDKGNWIVVLEDGSTLYAETFIQGDYRFMRWQLDDMWWWVRGTDTVYCESDAKSISRLLAIPQ